MWCYSVFSSCFPYVHALLYEFLTYVLRGFFFDFLNEQVRHMFDEIDYILEAKNAQRFASLYGSHQCKFIDTSDQLYIVT